MSGVGGGESALEVAREGTVNNTVILQPSASGAAVSTDRRFHRQAISLFLRGVQGTLTDGGFLYRCRRPFTKGPCTWRSGRLPCLSFLTISS